MFENIIPITTLITIIIPSFISIQKSYLFHVYQLQKTEHPILTDMWRHVQSFKLERKR